MLIGIVTILPVKKIRVYPYNLFNLVPEDHHIFLHQHPANVFFLFFPKNPQGPSNGRVNKPVGPQNSQAFEGSGFLGLCICRHPHFCSGMGSACITRSVVSSPCRHVESEDFRTVIFENVASHEYVYIYIYIYVCII